MHGRCRIRIEARLALLAHASLLAADVCAHTRAHLLAFAQPALGIVVNVRGPAQTAISAAPVTLQPLRAVSERPSSRQQKPARADDSG